MWGSQIDGDELTVTGSTVTPADGPSPQAPSWLIPTWNAADLLACGNTTGCWPGASVAGTA